MHQVLTVATPELSHVMVLLVLIQVGLSSKMASREAREMRNLKIVELLPSGKLT